MELQNLLYARVKNVIAQTDKNNVFAVFFGIGQDPSDDKTFHFIVGFGRDDAENGDDKWHLFSTAKNTVELFSDKPGKNAVKKWYSERKSEEDNAGYELIQLGVKIAERLFEEGIIENAFGRNIPVIFDDPDTSWYSVEATENANPDGLAAEFLLRSSKKRRQKNSGKDFATESAVSALGMFSALALFPNAIFMAIVTLIAGGVCFPLTGGGIAKLVLFALSVFSCISKAVQTKDETSSKEKARNAVFFIADLIVSAAVVFSCNFMTDRIIALAALICTVLWCAVDAARSRK